LWRKLITPRKHTLVRYTLYDDPLNISDSPAMNPMIIGEVRANYTLPLIAVARHAASGIDLFSLEERWF
jgi:hypothetical protein